MPKTIVSDETQPWFVVRLDDLVILGALVTHEAMISFPPGEVWRDGSLIYIFRSTARSVAEASAQEVDQSDLLIAPQVTNKMGWKHGVFESIERSGDVPILSKGHCFYSYPTDQYFDDAGCEVDPAEHEWIVQGGITYYQAICQLARDALSL